MSAAPDRAPLPRTMTRSGVGWMAVVLPLLLGVQGAAAATAAEVEADTDADAPHPLLSAVCRNEYAAVAELSPRRLDLNHIVWRRGMRNMTALDLALANGYWQIATLLQHSGAVASNNTLSVACDRRQAHALCERNPEWAHHQTCRASMEADRWRKSCHPPDRYCRQILQR